MKCRLSGIVRKAVVILDVPEKFGLVWERGDHTACSHSRRLFRPNGNLLKTDW